MSTPAKALVTSLVATPELKSNDEIFHTVLNHIQKHFNCKEHELTAYQLATIAHNATLLFDSAALAIKFIEQYTDGKRLAGDFSFRLPKNVRHPALWRYLAVTKEFLRKHNAPFVKILGIAHKVEILLELDGLLKSNKKHLITFELLMTYTLSAYSGIPVKTLEGDTQLNERVRLFFLKEFLAKDLKWFHEKLKTAESSDIEVPPLSLDAKDAKLNRKWYLIKLTPKDPRYGAIGVLTDCCLHAKNRTGKRILHHLMRDPKMDIYVICEQEGSKRSTKDSIIMGSYVQRISKEVLIFNAIFGTHRNFAGNDKIQDVYTFFYYGIQQLILHHSVDYVLAGKVFCVFNEYVSTGLIPSEEVLPKELLKVAATGEPHVLRSDLSVNLMLVSCRKQMHLLNIRLGNISTIEQLKKEWSDYEAATKDLNQAGLLIAEALKARNTDFALKLMDEIFSISPDFKPLIAEGILSIALFCSDDKIGETLFKMAELSEEQLANLLKIAIEYIPDKVDLLIKKGANAIFYLPDKMNHIPLLLALESQKTEIINKLFNTLDVQNISQFPENDRKVFLDLVKHHTPALIKFQSIFKISEPTLFANVIERYELSHFQAFLAKDSFSDLILSQDVPYHHIEYLKTYLPSSCTALHYIMAKLAEDFIDITLWDDERSFYQFAFRECLQHIQEKELRNLKFDYLDNEILNYFRHMIEILVKTENCKNPKVLCEIFGLPLQKPMQLASFKSFVIPESTALEKKEEGEKNSLSLN